MIASLKDLDWRGFLARPVLPAPSAEKLDAIASRPILLTGAGGSIGSALALRLAAAGANRLILLESSESSLLDLQQSWREARCPAAIAPVFVLGNAGHRAVLEEIWAAYHPRLVFHAAAYKHVPLLERQALAAVDNNVFLSDVLSSVSAAHGARVVLLSTDKAAAPASVLGVTKRIAEEIVLSRGGTALRLGNVLGSSGSVAEIFARQIAAHEPLTLTHPRARRYFLTLDEAVNILLQAAAHDSPGALLAPALPADHGIAELAGFLARTLAPGRDVPMQFSSLRPGDKLAEQLWADSETAAPVANAPLLRLRSHIPDAMQLEGGLRALRTAFAGRDPGAVLAALSALVPDYRPSEVLLASAQQRVCA